MKVLMVEQGEGEGEGEGEVFRDEEVGGIVEWYTCYSHLSSTSWDDYANLDLEKVGTCYLAAKTLRHHISFPSLLWIPRLKLVHFLGFSSPSATNTPLSLSPKPDAYILCYTWNNADEFKRRFRCR